METTIANYIGPKGSVSAGPKTAKLVFVGETLGEQEISAGIPFFGASGQELTRMLKQANIKRSEVFLTNVFNFRPQSGNLDGFLISPKAHPTDIPRLPTYRQGKLFHPKLAGELDRLKNELETIQPNLVVALGSVACWALLGSSGIGSLRGTIAESRMIPGLKVLPTYHPSAVLRDWSLRPIVIADLMKASREQAFPDIRRPKRNILVNPTLNELWAWMEAIPPDATLACDIETFKSMITMVGFACSPSEAAVVPFLTSEGNYWGSEADELEAWLFVKALLEGPWVKVFQNGLYDLQYLAVMGFRPTNLREDTMLYHHSLFPELQKGLGFLGSIYTNEVAWKLMRGNYDTNKRDE